MDGQGLVGGVTISQQLYRPYRRFEIIHGTILTEFHL